TRLAVACRALTTLRDTRSQIRSLTAAPRDAVHAFSTVIAALLSVGFEAADIPVDPDTSRTLVALVNFAQGKEYAGQERAIAGAALSSGRLTASDRQDLKNLVDAQDHAFELFSLFAPVERTKELSAIDALPQSRELARLRSSWLVSGECPVLASAEAWYQLTT